MKLVIDIGNSKINLALMKKEEVRHEYKIETMPDSELFAVKFSNLLEMMSTHFAIKQILMCSVVPKASKVVESLIRQALDQRPKLVGRDLKVPIKNKYERPRQVGKDRLVCAFAAAKLYGTPCVVIDSGTAITFDVVSKEGAYLGGVIVPGLYISAQALGQRTALLPEVAIKEPQHIIGRNTEESIQSGLFYGYGSLCDGMIQRLSQELGAQPKVIMTGGYAPMLKKYLTTKIDAIDEHLIFKGLIRL